MCIHNWHFQIDIKTLLILLTDFISVIRIKANLKVTFKVLITFHVLNCHILGRWIT